MRIVVVNESIYQIIERDFQKLFFSKRKHTVIAEAFDEKRPRREHERRCNYIREHGKLLMTADMILRDD